MYPSVFFYLPLLFSLALADGTVPQPPADPNAAPCPAQPVLDACISSTSAIASSCPLTDYNCLCQKNTDVLTCFNVCPNDPRRSSILSLQANYCANQSIYSSLSSTPIHPSSSYSAPTPSAPTSTASSVPTKPDVPKSSGTTQATPTNSPESSASKLSVSIISLIAVGVMFSFV